MGNCLGPLSIRPYTAVNADMPEISGTGMILGDAVQVG